MIIDKSHLNRREREIYIKTVQAYKKCYFAAKRKDRAVTRENAAILKQYRKRYPVVFIAFEEWLRFMWQDIKSRKRDITY